MPVIKQSVMTMIFLNTLKNRNSFVKTAIVNFMVQDVKTII